MRTSTFSSPCSSPNASTIRARRPTRSSSGPAAPGVQSCVDTRLEEPLGHGLLRLPADVLPPQLGDDPAARRALEEAELEQVRLVDVLDRVLLLAERHRECR